MNYLKIIFKNSNQRNLLNQNKLKLDFKHAYQNIMIEFQVFQIQQQDFRQFMVSNCYGFKCLEIKCLRNFKSMNQIISSINNDLYQINYEKPQITFLEQISQLSLKQYYNIQIGMSFISFICYDSSIIRNKQIQTIQEKTASRLLGKMYTQKFTVIIRTQFNKQKRVFKNIRLTKYNPEFGDWVLDQMDITLEWSPAKLIAEIVLQDKDKQLDRLKKFLNYILNQINKLVKLLSLKINLLSLPSQLKSQLKQFLFQVNKRIRNQYYQIQKKKTFKTFYKQQKQQVNHMNIVI
ncbi:unnamed protein product [Paramecium sonneborni]|uniref:Uncharacterized protein n=1 Tax=Paramecium sonneborni TaxID=65129 RepID=A0A8S1RS88_9CILI|nr:unnamed protein product [Paramecium sonneborni]